MFSILRLDFLMKLVVCPLIVPKCVLLAFLDFRFTKGILHRLQILLLLLVALVLKCQFILPHQASPSRLITQPC